jgi:choloylglycine hydrolase
MSKKAIVSAAILVAAALAAGRLAEACSLVLWNTNGVATLVARSWNLYVDEKPRLAFLPRGIARRGLAGAGAATWTSKFASVVLTAFDAGSGDGMNEAGLGAHLLYLHGTQYEPPDSRPGLSNLQWVQFVLDNYATVAEAVEGLKAVRVVSMPALDREWPVHLAIEDAGGDSAVLEFVQGRLVIHHGRDVTVMTNEPALDVQLANLGRYKMFGGRLAMPGDIDPMSRFVRASSYVRTLPPPASAGQAVALLAGVLHNVSVPFGALDTSGSESVDAWPTRWGTISDLTHKVYYVMPVNSPNVFWLDLARLNAASGEILVLDPYDVRLNGEVSGRLKAFSSVKQPFPPSP